MHINEINTENDMYADTSLTTETVYTAYPVGTTQGAAAKKAPPQEVVPEC